MKIPVSKKECIYLSDEYSKVFKAFFSTEEAKIVFSELDKKDPFKEGAIYAFLFRKWIKYLDVNQLLYNKNSKNLLLIKALPFFLLWIEFDFRSSYDIMSNFDYYEAFRFDENHLRDYKVGGYYDTKETY